MKQTEPVFFLFSLLGSLKETLLRLARGVDMYMFKKKMKVIIITSDLICLFS